MNVLNPAGWPSGDGRGWQSMNSFIPCLFKILKGSTDDESLPRSEEKSKGQTESRIKMSIRLVQFCTEKAVDMYLCPVSSGNSKKWHMISATIEQNRGRARSVFSTSTVTSLPYNRNPLDTYFCSVKWTVPMSPSTRSLKWKVLRKWLVRSHWSLNEIHRLRVCKRYSMTSRSVVDPREFPEITEISIDSPAPEEKCDFLKCNDKSCSGSCLPSWERSLYTPSWTCTGLLPV